MGFFREVRDEILSRFQRPVAPEEKELDHAIYGHLVWDDRQRHWKGEVDGGGTQGVPLSVDPNDDNDPMPNLEMANLYASLPHPFQTVKRIAVERFLLESDDEWKPKDVTPSQVCSDLIAESASVSSISGIEFTFKDGEDSENLHGHWLVMQYRKDGSSEVYLDG